MTILKTIIQQIYIRIKFHSRLKTYISSKIGFSSSFEGMNKVYPNSYFSGNMGYGSYIGPYCKISASIGRFSSIAPYVQVNHGIHPYKYPFVTTSPVFYSLAKQNGGTFAHKQMFDEFKYADEINKIPVIIGSDCWIGQGAFINGGINIGNGAVIFAYSVVTKDVPPYAIVAGIPGKIIGYRYDNETISFLLKLRWWDKDVNWLKAKSEYFCDIDKLRSVFYN